VLTVPYESSNGANACRPTATIMSNPSIRLCTTDHEQLRLRLQLADQTRAANGSFSNLKAGIERAEVVPDEALPITVARIGSVVSLRDLESGETDDYELCLPEQATPEEGRISVLAPLGLAVLGNAEGDAIASESPGGVRRLRIMKVGG
jgi:regulator of nucleoside diphosphate kinase